MKDNSMKYAKGGIRLCSERFLKLVVLATMLSATLSCTGGGDGTPPAEPEPLNPISLLTSGSSGITGSNPQISADGRYIVFTSFDLDLAVNDTNTNSDVFRYDTQTNEIVLVSVNVDGFGPNKSSYNPRISADGRYVVFLSDANDISLDDSDSLLDVFVRDIDAGTTTLVSVNSNGDKTDANCMQADISADGSLVAFACDSTAGLLDPADNNAVEDIFLRDLTNNTTQLVSYRDGQVLDDDSFNPTISGNGRFIAFASSATNLLDGDINSADDVFVYDIQTGQTELISINTAGDQGMGDSGGPAYTSDGGLDLSYDGSLVSFYSSASNLVEPNTDGINNYAYVRNRTTNTTTLVSIDDHDAPQMVINRPPALSANGRFVLYEGFESGGSHIRVRDLQNNTTEILDKNAQGDVADQPDSTAPWISADGRYVVFLSDSTNLVDGYVLDQEFLYKAPNLLY